MKKTKTDKIKMIALVIITVLLVLSTATLVVVMVPNMRARTAINKYYESVGNHPYYNDAATINMETITEEEFNLAYFNDAEYDLRDYLKQLFETIEASDESDVSGNETSEADETTSIEFDFHKFKSFYEFTKAIYEQDKDLMVLENGNYYVSNSWLAEAYTRYMNNAIQIMEEVRAKDAILDLYEKVVTDSPLTTVNINAPVANSAFNTMKALRNICADEELQAEVLELNNKLDRITKVAYESAFESATNTGIVATEISANDMIDFSQYTDEMKFQMFIGGCKNIDYSMTKTYLNTYDEALNNEEIALLEKVNDRVETLTGVYGLFGISSSEIQTRVARIAREAARKYSKSVNAAESKAVANKIDNNFWIWMCINDMGGIDTEDTSFTIKDYNNLCEYSIDIIGMNGSDEAYARECWTYAHQSVVDMVAIAAGINYDSYGIFSDLSTEMRDKYYSLYDTILYRACEDASYVFGYVGEYLYETETE